MADYGNRIPQLSFEIVRPVDDFAARVKSVVMIPGSGEFVYAPEPVNQSFGGGYFAAENVHTLQAVSDWSAALNQLEANFSNVENVSLVVSWFGTDLRADHCELKPGVELAEKTTTPMNWSIAGVLRSTAYVVSKRDGKPAYGGTPNDQSVVDAIRDLNQRGLKVTFNPFILMDVPDGNTLTNPYDGSAAQPVYPWRGRITVSPAPGQPGSPDQTAAAGVQVASLIGTADVSDFAISGDAVTYSGPNEWSLRRMVLHYAHLVKAAGGVDAFLLGSELRGLTWTRDGPGSYPFVQALVNLAADVRTVLGPGSKISYGADWSEFFGHQPGDGSGDVYFHLDPLWASPDIDAIGIDVYWPLADWRDGTEHLDYLAGTTSIYDLGYLRSNVTSGEGFNWYYASQPDRDAQVRTPITDGTGKPWVFRFKDIKSWWLNAHYNRPGGIESLTPTAWTPQSKPFWFTEIGCPAVDKGANQPNVFTDPKSSENALPYYSNGVRDDLMQRRFADAFLSAYDTAHPAYVSGANPLSVIDGRPMVDTSRIYLYAWDARPYPAFPFNTEIWGDGGNWPLGHWLSGRIAKAPVAEAVSRILTDYGFAAFDCDQLQGSLTGYIVDRIMSPRDALQALSLAFFFDVRESGGKLSFVPRGRSAAAAQLTPSDLVEVRAEAPLLTLTRGQETDLPATAKIRYIANRTGFDQAVADARRLVGASGRTAQADLAIVLDGEEAGAIAETWLHEAWIARETANFAVPPSQFHLEPGDVVSVDVNGEARPYRIKEISGLDARTIDALRTDRSIYSGFIGLAQDDYSDVTVVTAQAELYFLDLPILPGSPSPLSGYVAASQTPWPGTLSLFSSPEDSGFELRAQIPAPSIIGRVTNDIAEGVVGVFDYGNALTVTLNAGQLSSISDVQVFAGQNAAAIAIGDGRWEVLQFKSATLVGPNTYELTGLLRGQAGTDSDMQPVIAAGTAFVLLDEQITPVAVTADEIGLPYQWTYGPAHRDLSDATYKLVEHSFAGVGLRPLSPVHVRAERSGGDVVLTWLRRTRIGGDNWDSLDVPLGEDLERYEIDVLDGSEVKRTISTDVPSAIYTAAEQTADFGAPQSAITIRVYQISASYGRGGAATTVI